MLNYLLNRYEKQKIYDKQIVFLSSPKSITFYMLFSHEKVVIPQFDANC